MKDPLRVIGWLVLFIVANPLHALEVSNRACDQLLNAFPLPTKIALFDHQQTEKAYARLKEFRQLVFPSVTSPGPVRAGQLQLIKSNFGTQRTRIAGGYIKALEDAFTAPGRDPAEFSGRVFEGAEPILDMATKIGRVRESFERETRYTWSKRIRRATFAPLVTGGAVIVLRALFPGVDPTAFLTLAIGSTAISGFAAYQAGQALNEPHYDPQLAIQTVLHDPDPRDFVLIHGETFGRIMDIVAFVDDSRNVSLTLFQRPRPPSP